MMCAGGYAATKGLAQGAKQTAIAVDKASHHALEKAKAYDQKKAIEKCHKVGSSKHGGNRRSSLSVALVDGMAVPVPAPGGAMASMPEGVELKVIDGVPVAVPRTTRAPAIGVAVETRSDPLWRDFQADDV